MINRRVAAFFAVLAAVSGHAIAKGDPTAGQSRATGCASCHGPNGTSPTEEWPNLAGQGRAYLVKQMKAFRDGGRQDPLMSPMAKPLTDQEIDDLAAFYTAQKPAPSGAAVASAQPAAASGPVPHPPIVASPEFVVPTAHTMPQYWVDKLPEGDGRATVIQKCQLCHTLQRAIAYARPKKEWQNVVESMIERGSPMTPAEVPVMVDYLTKHFGPDSPPIAEVGMKSCKRSEWPKGSSDFRSGWKGTYTVWVSNQQGGNVDVIDPATNKIVRRINCVSAPDRVEFSHDGNTAYVPDRVEHNVTVIDTHTGAIKAKVPLIDRPNSAAMSLDSKKLYVGIWPVSADEGKRGYIQVLDTATLKIVKTIETKGGIHLPLLSPDGKQLMALSSPGKFMDVYDTRTDKLLYTCCTAAEIGTMVMEPGSDGSSRRILFSYSRFNGLVVADAKTGHELERIDHPVDTDGPSKGVRHPIQTLLGFGFHGSEISPDGKSLWVITASYVYRYELPSLKPIGDTHLAVVDQLGNPLTQSVEGTALTHAPDGKKVYAVRGARNLLSVIDAQTAKEEVLIPTGEYGLHVSIGPGASP